MGFACQLCGTTTFVLKVQPSVEQQLHITTNAFGDVLITVGNAPTFQADLGFMNRFASCTGCGAIKHWQYEEKAPASEPINGIITAPANQPKPTQTASS